MDYADLRAAVELLENEPVIGTWTIAKVVNPTHSIQPVGVGVIITVDHWTSPFLEPGEAIRALEKAGTGRSMVDAATAAIARVKYAIAKRSGIEANE